MATITCSYHYCVGVADTQPCSLLPNHHKSHSTGSHLSVVSNRPFPALQIYVFGCDCRLDSGSKFSKPPPPAYHTTSACNNTQVEGMGAFDSSL